MKEGGAGKVDGRGLSGRGRERAARNGREGGFFGPGLEEVLARERLGNFEIAFFIILN